MYCSISHWVTLDVYSLHSSIFASRYLLNMCSPSVSLTRLLRLISSRASFRFSGRQFIPSSSICSCVILYTFLSTGAGGSIFLSMPSSPALRIMASVRYGLHDGSGHLNSIRVRSPLSEGILISGLLFLRLCYIDRRFITGTSLLYNYRWVCQGRHRTHMFHDYDKP